MQKIFSIVVLFSGLVFLAQCTKDKAPKPSACNVSTVSYVSDVKPILDANCATSGCHDAITQQSGFDYSTYAAASAGGEGAMCKIQGSCGSIMPPAGKLADSLICIIEGWKNQAYPQ